MRTYSVNSRDYRKGIKNSIIPYLISKPSLSKYSAVTQDGILPPLSVPNSNFQFLFVLKSFTDLSSQKTAVDAFLIILFAIICSISMPEENCFMKKICITKQKRYIKINKVCFAVLLRAIISLLLILSIFSV